MSVADYRVIGVPPDLTEGQFVAILRAAGSPAAEAGQAVYRACVARRVSPVFLLAVFRHESGMGLAGWATTTRSWGNTRPPSYGAPEIGAYQQDTRAYTPRPGPYSARSLCAYADWAAGGISTVARLVEHPAYRGLTTVREIVPVWAPASDGNIPAAYIAAVLGAVKEWTGGGSMGSVPRPRMTSTPSPNRGGYGTPHRPRAIVAHITAGTDSLGWLTSPASNASSNYLITSAGAILELVPPTESAWANGQVAAPDTSNPFVAAVLAEGVNFNTRTISIEVERRAGEPYTAAQREAFVALAAWLCQEFAITPDAAHILPHRQIDGRNRANCPGAVNEAWLVGARREIAALVGGGTVTAPPSPPQPDPVSAALLSWYRGLPQALQGDLSNDRFYEADVTFDSIYPAIVGPQRAVVGEYVACWMDVDGTIRPIFPRDRVRLEDEGRMVRR